MMIEGVTRRHKAVAEGYRSCCQAYDCGGYLRTKDWNSFQVEEQGSSKDLWTEQSVGGMKCNLKVDEGSTGS